MNSMKYIILSDSSASASVIVVGILYFVLVSESSACCYNLFQCCIFHRVVISTLSYQVTACKDCVSKGGLHSHDLMISRNLTLLIITSDLALLIVYKYR